MFYGVLIKLFALQGFMEEQSVGSENNRGETINTTINLGLSVSELKGGFRFGTDSLLLAYFTKKGVYGCDIGSGCGVVSLLLLESGRAKKMLGVEKVKEYADISVLNAEKNGFAKSFRCVVSDVKDAAKTIKGGECDFAVMNPPYHKAFSGKKSGDALKSAAFHEQTGDIFDFCACAGHALKYGGRFFSVYRPEYTAKLILAMERAGIKPKRLRFVSPSPGKAPSLVLAEGKKGGSDGMKVEPNLYIYADITHKSQSAEMEKIYYEFS